MTETSKIVQIETFLYMINVGDVEYQNILGGPPPGRWFRGSVNWAF